MENDKNSIKADKLNIELMNILSKYRVIDLDLINKIGIVMCQNILNFIGDLISLMISEKIEPEKILIRGAEKNIELTLTKNQENIIYNFHTEFWITKVGSIYDGDFLCGEIYLTILIDLKKNTYKIPKFKCKYDADICYQTENLSNSQEESNVVDVPKKDYSKYYKYGPIALGIGGIVATPFLLGVLGGKNKKIKRKNKTKNKTKNKNKNKTKRK